MNKIQKIRELRQVSIGQVEKHQDNLVIKKSSLSDTFNNNKYLNYAVFRYLPYDLRRKVLKDQSNSILFTLQDMQNMYDLAKYDIADEVNDKLTVKHQNEINIIRKQYEHTIQQLIKDQQPKNYSDIFI